MFTGVISVAIARRAECDASDRVREGFARRLHALRGARAGWVELHLVGAVHQGDQRARRMMRARCDSAGIVRAARYNLGPEYVRTPVPVKLNSSVWPAYA